MHLRKHPQETLENKLRLTKLMERWTRDLLEMPENLKMVRRAAFLLPAKAAVLLWWWWW
jgi:hypothetical protein